MRSLVICHWSLGGGFEAMILNGCVVKWLLGIFLIVNCQLGGLEVRSLVIGEKLEERSLVIGEKLEERSLVNCHWSLGRNLKNGHWSFVIGHWRSSEKSGHWSLVKEVRRKMKKDIGEIALLSLCSTLGPRPWAPGHNKTR